MAPTAETVAAFSAEVEHLASEPVSMRRHGKQWRLEVRVRQTRRLSSEGFGFSQRTLRLGRKSVTLGDQGLQIVQVTLEDNMLSLLIEEVKAHVAEAEQHGRVGDALLAEVARVLEAIGDDPLRVVFARRALRSIGHLATDATADAIAVAAGSSTDTEAVIRALEQPEALSILSDSDPLAAAKLRGLRERERLLQAEGGTWDTIRVAGHLHLSRQGVNRRRRAGSLLAIDVGRLGYRFPAWQFVRGGTLAGLEPVLSALRRHDPWMQLSFMLGPNPRLDGKTPLEGLKEGRSEEVEEAAGAFGEHGAP